MSVTTKKSKATKKVAKSKTRESQTIGDLHAKGKLRRGLLVPITALQIDALVKKAFVAGWDSAESHSKNAGGLFISGLMLPNGTRFGDAMPVDLAPYADLSMEQIIASLIDPDKDNEADFIEDGSRPMPAPAADSAANRKMKTRR